MSLGAGPRGYKDWQRVVNWDAPLLIDKYEVTLTGFFQSEVFNVERYAYLMGQLATSEEFVRAVLTFYSDAAGTKQLFAQTIWLSNITSFPSGLVHLPLGGPYVKLTLEPMEPEGKYKAYIRLFPSNRVHALSVIPSEPLLLNMTHVFAGKGSFGSPQPTLYAGPVRMSLQTAQAVTATARLEAQVGHNEWALVDFIEFAGPQTKVQSMVIPLTGWRVVLESSAAATLECKLYGSMSGST